MLSLWAQSSINEPAPLSDNRWFSWIVLAVSLTLTTAGTLVLERTTAKADAARFSGMVDINQERLQRRLENYAAMISKVADWVENDPEPLPGNAAFSRAIAKLDLPANYPGVSGVGFSVPIPLGAEAALLRWLSEQGNDNPHIWPEGKADQQRLCVVACAPDLSINRKLIGFDLARDKANESAMTAALQLRRLQAGGATPLPLENDLADNPGFLGFMPINTKSDPPRVRGFVFAAFRSADFNRHVFGDESTAQLGLSVVDSDTQKTLYASNAFTFGGFESSRSIDVFGRRWQIDYHATPAFESTSSQSLVLLFGSAGLVLGFGLFLVARSQGLASATNSSLYRRSLAAKREAELNLDINRRLASTLDPQAMAQALTDAGRELTNAAFGAFFTAGNLGKPQGIYAVSGDVLLAASTQEFPKIARLLRSHLKEPEVVRIPDIRDLPSGTITTTLPFFSFLEVMIRSSTGDILGSLLYVDPLPQRFTADHERLLLGLAAQAAIAYDKARLFEAERQAKRIADRRAEDLAHANAELQQFVYVSSHDLQEPLRTITQYLDLLRRRNAGAFDERSLRYITYASDSASRMYALLNDLLTYARLGRDAERTPVDLRALLNEISVDLALKIAETGAKLEIADLPTLHCDYAKIRSLFLNLIGNALKFRSEHRPLIHISCNSDPLTGQFTFRIADNGIGIQPDHREAIFEVFHRLHDRGSFPGNGIGLAICRKVVEQHRGKIWVEESPGGGTTFVFTLTDGATGLNPKITTS